MNALEDHLPVSLSKLSETPLKARSVARPTRKEWVLKRFDWRPEFAKEEDRYFAMVARSKGEPVSNRKRGPGVCERNFRYSSRDLMGQ